MTYQGLKQFIQQFQEESGLKVVIKDFVGFLDWDEELFEAVQDFYIHKSPFCMYIKESKRLWDYCLMEKKLLYQRLLREPVPFYGCCYANVMEYVIPILYKDTLIAALTVGSFKVETEKSHHKLNQLVKRQGLDPLELDRTYEQSTVLWENDFETAIHRLNIIAEYLALAYSNLKRDEKEKIKLQHEMSKPYVLSHALEYIKLHYKEDVSLETLARFCHCSKSYISHQFRLYTQMTLKTYVNHLRINEAKELLSQGKSITEIAFWVGFKDSNYFSKVFRELEQMTPTDYYNRINTISNT